MQSSDPGGRLQIAQSPLGVSIRVMDTDKKTPMFKSGEAELTPDAKRVIKWLSERLNQWPYQIIIEGRPNFNPKGRDLLTYIDSFEYILSIFVIWQISLVSVLKRSFKISFRSNI